MAKKIDRILRHIKGKIFVILCTILFMMALPLLTIFFIAPCFIYRWLLSKYVKLCRPDLGKLLCARSALAANDEIYSFPKCTLLGVAVVEGDVTIDGLKADVQRRIINATDSQGDLMYPELQQYFYRFGGYLFWKWGKVCVDNHVSEYQSSEGKEVFDDLDLMKIRVELINKPFKKEVSPWDFTVVKNYQPKFPLMIDSQSDGESQQKSVLIMRIHHGCTDGYSMLKLWLNTMQSENMNLNDIPQPVYHEKRYFQSLLYHTWAVLCAPYYVVSQLLTTYDDNFFHPKGTELIRKNAVSGVTFSASIIKEIRDRYKTTFTAVLMAALAGGIRNFMLKHGIPIPQKMHVTQPLPWPGHPDKLRNFWSFCIINLPLQVTDPRKRLKILHDRREALVKSIVPFLNLKLVPLVGSLPTPIIQWATKRKATTIMMSNFPGPQEPSSMLGYKILDASFGGGLGRGNLGFGISMISYNGTMRIGLGVDQSIFPNQSQAHELVGLIREEINVLHQDCVV